MSLQPRPRDPVYIIMAFWVLCALDKISIAEYPASHFQFAFFFVYFFALLLAFLVVLRSRCLSGLPLVLCDIKIDSKSLQQRISSAHFSTTPPASPLTSQELSSLLCRVSTFFCFMALSSVCKPSPRRLGKLFFHANFNKANFILRIRTVCPSLWNITMKCFALRTETIAFFFCSLWLQSQTHQSNRLEIEKYASHLGIFDEWYSPGESRNSCQKSSSFHMPNMFGHLIASCEVGLEKRRAMVAKQC